MKVTKAMKLAKRAQITKDKFDLKQRGFTDAQYESFTSLLAENGNPALFGYLKDTKGEILKGVKI